MRLGGAAWLRRVLSVRGPCRDSGGGQNRDSVCITLTICQCNLSVSAKSAGDSSSQIQLSSEIT